MKIERLVLGVLDISDEIDDSIVAEKYRDFTIAWSRYDYRDELIEALTVDDILAQAVKLEYRWCLILPHGHIIAERWTHQPDAQDCFSWLKTCIDHDDFLVAGGLVGEAGKWFGFENRCLFVNLETYQRLSAPKFDVTCHEAIELPVARRRIKQDRITGLLPSQATEVQQPSLDGWNWIATSLRASVPVLGFEQRSPSGVLSLSATCPARTRAFAKYLNHGIERYHPEEAHDDLDDDQVAFLNMVQPQTSGARNGVFLWNIEGYADIETPAADFRPPISTLYCVAAGFKPNRILHTHGFDKSTRVVYFDYSPQALEVKRYMVNRWDGKNFSDFVPHLFAAFPHPETFYQLWDGLTPEEIDPSDIQRMWQRELQHWGSDPIFREHWQAYRELPHEYICCNILTDPAPLFDRIREEPNAIAWWSNAFFTMYGNWFYTLDQRRQMYDNWIQHLARLNPELYLFGSDCNNVSVNSMRALEYWDAYRRAGGSCLIPRRLSETQIRM